MSIRLRLVLWFCACLLLVSLCLGVAVFLMTRAVAFGNFHEMAVAQLQRVQEKINTFLAPGIMATEYLAELDAVQDSAGRLTSYMDTTERTTLLYKNHTPHEQLIYDEFMRVKNYNANFDLVFMANNDGQVTQAPEGRYKDAGYDPRKRPWFRELAASPERTIISSPYRTTGADIVCSIMTKTVDLLGKPLGMVGVDYKLTSLTDDLIDRQVLKTGYLVIFDPTGRIIVDSHHADYVGHRPNESAGGTALGDDELDGARELRMRLINGPDGEYTGIGDRGLPEYAVSYTLPDTKWKLAVIFERSEMLESSYAVSKRILVVSLPLLAAALLLTSVITLRISQPLTAMARHCSKLALGDITIDVPEAIRRRPDEIGLLGRSLQDMIQSSRDELNIADLLAQGDYSQSLPLRSDLDSLGKALDAMVKMNHDALLRIAQLVDIVNRGAEFVSSASLSLSNGAQTSASALEEISTTLSQMDSQARDNAQNAQEANTIAGIGRDAARRGYHAMRDLGGGMEKIQESGRKIGSVVKVINDIAFQTNLLSLNASVEAARAGRHGKGFSVVAEEVRNLAARSARAAQETGAMVEDMVQQIVAGAQLAERSDQEFRDIVETVDKIVLQIDNIASASASQSVAISQIVASLNQVESVTHENSKHAGDLSQSAANLSRQAEELQRIVAHFRLSRRNRRALGYEAGEER